MSDLKKENDSPVHMGQELTDEIEALERLEKAATPGPWGHRGEGMLDRRPQKQYSLAGVEFGYVEGISMDQAVSDAVLVEALRNNALPLIARLHAALVVAEKERDDLLACELSRRPLHDTARNAVGDSLRLMKQAQISRDEALADLGKMREERDEKERRIPREPTQAMLNAAIESWREENQGRRNYETAWRAMWDAANV